MIIGIPKEIKVREYRVGIVPSGVKTLRDNGHKVLIEKGAGVGAGIPDKDYTTAGAEVLESAVQIWEKSDMIMKVKEPLPAEYKFFRENLIIFTYFHLAPEAVLTERLVNSGITAVAYETIQLPDGSLPLLTPMSEIAGKMAIQVGASFLEKEHGGRGILLGGVPGVKRGSVVIIGAGIVGMNAAKIAVGMGANVTILDVNLAKLAFIDDLYGNRIQTLFSDHHNIEESVLDADLVVGAVLIAGARAPIIVREELVARMNEGSVIVDVAVDQGGCIETVKPTTHDDPTFKKHGVLHYCVANMPGAVARTSTFALTNTTIPYAVKIANRGIEKASREDESLCKGINVHKGAVTCEAVAKSLNLDYKPLTTIPG